MVLQIGIQNEPPKFWGRNWNVIVELDGGQVINGKNNAEGLNVSELRVVFNVEKDIQMTTTNAEIKIYNLNSTVEQLFLRWGSKVYLEAGYNNPSMFGQIFYGDIWQILRDWDDQLNNFVSIKAIKDPGGLVWNSAITSVKRGTNYRSVLAQVAQASKLELGQIPENWGLDRSLSRGFSCFGATKDVLNGIASSTNTIINIEDNKINVIDLEQPYTGEAFELNYKTGLVGRPRQTREGITCKSLINPAMELNTWLHLNNTDITSAEIQMGEMTQQQLDQDGLYRITRQVFTGDTRGNDWYIEHSCLSQAGGYPDFMMNAGQGGI